jgi:hypothetical protein
MGLVKLDDAQMRQFIRDGYVLLKTGLPPEFHQALFRKTGEVFESEGNPGNNLLPRIPAVGKVFSDPAVAGALASVLGPDYFMEPHRHCHYKAPGSEGQELHKDSFTRRRHHTRRVLAFYYPQDTTEDMGPTSVVPGSHYYNTLAGGLHASEERSLTVEAGSVAIVNYDIWHRGTANRSNRPRYMMKFLFARISEPEAPTWDGGEEEWTPAGGEAHTAMLRHMWDWYGGMANGDGTGGHRDSNGPVDGLAEVVANGSEHEAIDAAYKLGSAGSASVPDLIELLKDDSGREWWEQKLTSTKGRGLTSASANASYGLSAAGQAAVPALVEATRDERWWLRATAAETLGDIGPPAADSIGALSALADDELAEVRAEATHALGTVGQTGSSAVPYLTRALTDEDDGVRREASMALARTGPHAEEAVQALTAALEDEDRYVRGNSVHALYRMDTPAARDALLDHLIASRWCYSTTKDSTF